MPPFTFAPSASSGASGHQQQANGYDFGAGQVWNVNIGGSGTSTQGASATTGGIKPWMIAAAALAAYLALR